MRLSRMKADGAAYYHVTSRCIDRQKLLDDNEKERLRVLLHAAAGFTGCTLVTYTILDNHFHALVHVPRARDVDEPEMFARLRCLYTPRQVADIAAQLRRYREHGQEQMATALCDRYRARMHDVSQFAKIVKERMTQSYNRRHNRSGTMWAGRFGSVLLEGEASLLEFVSTYIDLNSLRAGIVRDPLAYRFSGYAGAMNGCPRAQGGLAFMFADLGRRSDWEHVSRTYSTWLLIRGSSAMSKPGQRCLSNESSICTGAEAPADIRIGSRQRFISDTLVAGSRAFVDDSLKRYFPTCPLRREPSKGMAKTHTGRDVHVGGRVQSRPPLR